MFYVKIIDDVNCSISSGLREQYMTYIHMIILFWVFDHTCNNMIHVHV